MHAVTACTGFTFHYVSILILAQNSEKTCGKFVYIPLCLYFNQYLLVRAVRGEDVYIPLCLYFNFPATSLHCSYSPFTFHYVSILIESMFTEISDRAVVYIPLCLYFNPSQERCPTRIQAFTFHYVSILIVFYEVMCYIGNEFTFHYVSILIFSLSAPFFLLSSFTFHYVSILIKNTPRHIASGAYSLHSIMSLF